MKPENANPKQGPKKQILQKNASLLLFKVIQ